LLGNWIEEGGITVYGVCEDVLIEEGCKVMKSEGEE
jgi:hypothetical protein